MIPCAQHADWRGLDPRLVLPTIRRLGGTDALACAALMGSLLVQTALVVPSSSRRAQRARQATS